MNWPDRWEYTKPELWFEVLLCDTDRDAGRVGEGVKDRGRGRRERFLERVSNWQLMR